MDSVKKIGIWGYGVFGKSAVTYFSQHNYQLSVIDKKQLSDADLQLLAAHHVAVYPQEQIAEFLRNNPQVIASPGVDIQPYVNQAQFLQELDVFYTHFHKPIIAITGSIGKTTITHLLSKLLLQAGKKIVTGGNIGTPMFDLLEAQNAVDLAVLEVSSFQLEHCTQFAPQLAIWTNVYPNHLDRHKTIENYIAAKERILAHQDNTQHALLPLSLKNKASGNGKAHYFAMSKPTHDEMQDIDTLYFVDQNSIYKAHSGIVQKLINCQALPECTFIENWLILCAALDILKIPLAVIERTELDVPEHRLEKVAVINSITFYNDSKSTTMQSTLAAVEALQAKPVYLLLGGLSKGVDRKPLVAALQGKTAKIFCFGAEAEQLHAWCQEHLIPADNYATLTQAFEAAVEEIRPDAQLLLSPAGSSFDLYKDYKERGAHFKHLVNSLKH